MLKKIILASAVTVLIFAPFATGKVLSLKEFGISVGVKNFYSKVGSTYTGRVVDPVKLRYTNDAFKNANKGDRIKVTNLGNGQVELKNLSTGESETIDVNVGNRSAYIWPEYKNAVYSSEDLNRDFSYKDRAVPQKTASARVTVSKPQFEVTQDVDSVVTAIKSRFTPEEIRQIVNRLNN